MAIARRGIEDSDVYVFHSMHGGFTCQWFDHHFNGTPEEMIRHLQMHEYEGGDTVPASVYEFLHSEVSA